MTPAIKEVTVEPEFILRIEYKNGECRILDMRPWLSIGIFRRISDSRVFSTVWISFDTLEWQNGVDIDPEFVYSRSIPA